MTATLSLIIAMALWGSSFIAMKYAVSGFEPEVAMFFRMLVTLISCLFLWRWVKQFQYQRGDWKPLLIMSLSEPCLYFLFEGHAMQYTSASQAGVLVACLPLMVAVIAYLALGERASKHTFIGFSTCIIGSIILTLASPTDDHAPNPVLGNTLEALAMLCAAIYTISVKYLSSRYSPLSLIGLQGLSGTLFFACFLPFSNTTEVTAQLLDTQNWQILVSIAYLGLFVTLGAYGLYTYSLSKVSVMKVAAYSSLIPIFALFLSAIFLHERMNLVQWMGVGLVLLGVYVSQKHGQASQETESMQASASS